MHHIEVGRARLATWDSGGSGPALVALHAGVADSRAWETCVPTWSASDWRVITYDRRGFGRSAWDPEPFGHVADLIAVMDALDLPSAVLVGNSQGGRISLDAALTTPQRVDGLLLVGTAITGAPVRLRRRTRPGPRTSSMRPPMPQARPGTWRRPTTWRPTCGWTAPANPPDGSTASRASCSWT